MMHLHNHLHISKTTPGESLVKKNRERFRETLHIACLSPDKIECPLAHFAASDICSLTNTNFSSIEE